MRMLIKIVKLWFLGFCILIIHNMYKKAYTKLSICFQQMVGVSMLDLSHFFFNLVFSFNTLTLSHFCLLLHSLQLKPHMGYGVVLLLAWTHSQRLFSLCFDCNIVTLAFHLLLPLTWLPSFARVFFFPSLLSLSFFGLCMLCYIYVGVVASWDISILNIWINRHIPMSQNPHFSSLSLLNQSVVLVSFLACLCVDYSLWRLIYLPTSHDVKLFGICVGGGVFYQGRNFFIR